MLWLPISVIKLFILVSMKVDKKLQLKWHNEQFSLQTFGCKCCIYRTIVIAKDWIQMNDNVWLTKNKRGNIKDSPILKIDLEAKKLLLCMD